MSDLWWIVTVWSGLLVVPTLGVVACDTRRSVGQWPWAYGVTASAATATMTASLEVRWREYVAGWRADYREGEVPRRLAAFTLSFGLLYRASIHSLVAALSYPDGPPGEVDHGLVWTPLPMARTPLWTARMLTVGSGVVLAVLTGWPVWGWPEWAAWSARAYLLAQCGVWCAEPIVITKEIFNGT